jgi:hypothetical protein
MEEVVVNGEFPGPGMWKVWRADDPLHVLWIVGDPPPLPKRMQWKSRDVESVVLRAQAILLDASVRMEPDEKIGVFRGLSLLPAAMKARRNPDGGTLREQLPPQLYARWLAQKKLYIGRDGGVEDWRPLFAADKLRRAAFDDLELRDSGMVWDVVGKLARKRKLPVITPHLEFRFHTRDLKTKIREFSRESLADTECFAATLDLTEALDHRIAPRACLGDRRPGDARQPAAAAQSLRALRHGRARLRSREGNHSHGHPRAAVRLVDGSGGENPGDQRDHAGHRAAGQADTAGWLPGTAARARLPDRRPGVGASRKISHARCSRR